MYSWQISEKEILEAVRKQNEINKFNLERYYERKKLKSTLYKALKPYKIDLVAGLLRGTRKIPDDVLYKQSRIIFGNLFRLERILFHQQIPMTLLKRYKKRLVKNEEMRLALYHQVLREHDGDIDQEIVTILIENLDELFEYSKKYDCEKELEAIPSLAVLLKLKD